MLVQALSDEAQQALQLARVLVLVLVPAHRLPRPRPPLLQLRRALVAPPLLQLLQLLQPRALAAPPRLQLLQPLQSRALAAPPLLQPLQLLQLRAQAAPPLLQSAHHPLAPRALQQLQLQVQVRPSLPPQPAPPVLSVAPLRLLAT